jgi:hypothetical protein
MLPREFPAIMHRSELQAYNYGAQAILGCRFDSVFTKRRDGTR